MMLLFKKANFKQLCSEQLWIFNFSSSLWQLRNALLHYNQHNDFTDEELLLHYRQSGNKEWLGVLLQRYTLLLLGVAMKYLKDKSSSEDAVQQVFLKALTHLPEGKIENFKGWLYVLMRNYCFQVLRDKHYQLPDENLLNFPDTETTKMDLEWKDFTLDQMENALQQLNDEQRKAITMFYLQKMSYQQIMEQTGFSYMQVKSFIQNGKRNLKMILIKKLGNSRL